MDRQFFSFIVVEPASAVHNNLKKTWRLEVKETDTSRAIRAWIRTQLDNGEFGAETTTGSWYANNKE
ncbi:hypothetical protein R1flu_003326 [Riccia fluitans]|uniref:Uncharacterized protein n=1 Tax=Riccia fluitans TaxID=41844 RepID=A0ABD1Y8P2_9MARC